MRHRWLRERVENRQDCVPKMKCQKLRPYRYLKVPKEDRENPHLASERVGPYWYLRWGQFDWKSSDGEEVRLSSDRTGSCLFSADWKGASTPFRSPTASPRVWSAPAPRPGGRRRPLIPSNGPRITDSVSRASPMKNRAVRRLAGRAVQSVR